MASTDHLRVDSMAPNMRSASVSAVHTPQRYRSASLASSSSSSYSADGGSRHEADGSSDAHGLQRSASAATPRSNGLWSKPAPTSSNGLWSKPATAASPTTPDQTLMHQESPLRESIASSDLDVFKQKKEGTPKPIAKEDEAPEGSSGLWGSPPTTPPSPREKGPKRRWTHHEHR